VPADRLAEISAELEPVFELLADTEAAADRIRRAAEHDAKRTVADATIRAEVLVADASVRAEAARADAAARGRDDAAAEEALLVRTAAADVTRLRARVAGGMSGYVARAVESASAELRAVAGSPGEPGSVTSPGDPVGLDRVRRGKP
jgi:vacuolar-type H+-ATPase subunit H